MKSLSIDIETYSAAPLKKCGVYRYCTDSSFEILLFGYSADGGPAQVVDFTAGDQLPAEVLSALTDPAVTKWAFNAQFERVCLSRWLGVPVGEYLEPDSWRCTMVWSATLGLPLSLEGVGAVLGLEKQMLDCDNDHSEDPAAWITPQVLADSLLGVAFAVHYSRNNGKAKNGKAARPKFHVFFPIPEQTGPTAYSDMKKRLQTEFPFFDSNVETAKANGLRPFRYFQFLLERLPVGTSADDCAPWNDAAQDLCR